VVYTKDEIKSLEKNRRRKLRGKPYQVSFESSSLRFFVSRDSLANKSFAAFLHDLMRKNKKEAFIECTGQYEEVLRKEFYARNNDSFACEWPNLISTNKYYTTRRRSRYCFKLYEISGWFIKFRVDTEEERDAIGKKMRYIDPNLKDFFAYFFLRSESHSTYNSSLGKQVQLWKEVPPILE
jgi:hypothetical protein